MARRSNASPGGDLRDPRDILDELEQDIERLKVLYEQYFRGVERVPPARLLDKVERQFRNLQRGYRFKTVTRFRMQGLKARLVTYKHYWQRILTQMERGTFRRDMLRAQRRQAAIEEQAAAAQAAAEAAAAEGEAAGEEGDDSQRKKRPRPRRPASPASLPDGVTAGEVRALFKDLVAAKKAAGESVTGLTYGALVKKLAREVPKLRDRHGCDSVHFEVSTSGGKVKLRARPGTG